MKKNRGGKESFFKRISKRKKGDPHSRRILRMKNTGVKGNIFFLLLKGRKKENL